MSLVSVTCPNCGAKLQTTLNAKMLTCDYCNCDVVIDDEVKWVKLQEHCLRLELGEIKWLI